MITRKNFLIGAAATAATASAIDCESFEGSCGRARGLVGGAFMGTMLSQQGVKAWANPYVTDGLIAMWDGEWNAGGGVHDASATGWTDISGNGHDAVGVYQTSDRTPPTWASNGFVCTKAYGVFFWNVGKVLQGTSNVTLEIAVSNALSNIYRWFFASSTRNYYLKIQRYDTNNTLTFNVAGEVPYYSTSPALTAGLISASVTYDGTSRRVYRAGELKNTDSVSQDYAAGAAQADYGIAQQNVGTGTVYHNVRLYNRALTADEVASNYAVDRARFNLS